MSETQMVLCGLEAVTRGTIAEVRLNDIPVATVGPPEGAGRAFVPVPAYVVRGTNQLSARFTPTPGPDAASPRAEVRVAVFQDGDRYFSNAGQELARLDWAGDSGPTTRNREFHATFGPPRWAWSRCDAWLTPDTALADALPFVRDLTRAYFASDAAWMETFSSAKFSDLALAFTNISEDGMKAQVASVIRREAPQPVPALAPPVPALCGDGRMLMLLGHDGLPYLRKTGSDSHLVCAEVLLGKLGGAWQIVR